MSDYQETILEPMPETEFMDQASLKAHIESVLSKRHQGASVEVLTWKRAKPGGRGLDYGRWGRTTGFSFYSWVAVRYSVRDAL